MNNFGEEEINFVKASIKMGVRMDQRTLLQERETPHITKTLPQTDGYIRLRKGETELEISVQFKETKRMLHSLSLIESEEEISNTIESNIVIPEIIKNIISKKLYDYKLGLRVETTVFTDDGNVTGLLVFGLKTLLSYIEIPDVENLGSVIPLEIYFPDSVTLASINNVIINDPTKLEEKASDYVVTLYFNNEDLMEFTFSKCSSLSQIDISKLTETACKCIL